MTAPIIESIYEAFRDTAFPGIERICESNRSFEAGAVISAFQEKTSWVELDAEFLDSAPDGLGSALTFFSPEALQFYLPAYLIADLKGLLQFVEPEYILCFAFTYLRWDDMPRNADGSLNHPDLFFQRFEIFDAAQCTAIDEYLRWVGQRVSDPMVENAIKEYWEPRSRQGGSLGS